MAHCDRNLAVELVLDFLRTPAETTCGHLAVYDNNIREFWTGKFKLLGKKFARPKVKWMPFKSCECLRCRSGGCVYCNRTSYKWNSRSQRQASWRSFWPKSDASGRVRVQPVHTTIRTSRLTRRTENGPPPTLRGLCLLLLFPFIESWIFVKVNELCESADCQSAGLDVKCLCEAIAQVDRNSSACQMLQLFLGMLRQRATHGRSSGQDRKADGQDRCSPSDSHVVYASFTFITQKINES
jgi:hypothetical protein